MGFTPRCDEDGIGIDVGQILYGGFHLKDDAALLHHLTQTLGTVCVKHWQTLLHKLYDRYLRAKALENGSKLHANDAGTNDAKTLGQGGQLQQFCGCHHPWVGVNASNGRHLGAATRGNDDMFGTDGVATSQSHGMAVEEGCRVTDKGNAWCRQNPLDTGTKLLHHLLLALKRLSKRGTVNIRLGRNTTAVQAGASHFAFLYDNHLQALLGCIFSGAVATRPRTDNA